VLFQPYRLGPFNLRHRIVMAPLTRSRARQPGNVPSSLAARYYAQRASAALIVSEATQVSMQGQGYAWTPGIHSREQVEAWHRITQTVHQADGRLREGKADLIAFGRKFIANPDLPERLRIGAPFNADDPTTYYGGGEKGYTDYPSLERDRGEQPKACFDQRWR
jgi:2,4-dienoyl-CoA reductase-like NADH-dependent reductase (Old Yellow Enzyme family)